MKMTFPRPGTVLITVVAFVAGLMVGAACSAREAPPMAGACADRQAPNVFGGLDEVVSYKECRWQGRTWVCRLEDGAEAWRCVAVTW